MRRYYRHFGLQRDPFLDTADPFFYLETPALHRHAERLLASVEESRGLAVVTGAPGTGKTSLCTSVELQLLRDENVVIGKVLDPSFRTEVELLLGFARVFGLALPPQPAAALKNALKNYLFDTAVLEKRTVVLLVDEAQNLPPDGFEAIRLLLNFHVPEKKLLNVLLFGQLELDNEIAKRPNLADRVDAQIRLDVPDPPTAQAILEHRLERAGGPPARGIFAQGAIDLVVSATGGLPRRLANLARSSMIEAAERGSERVLEDHVRAALRSGILIAAPATNGSAAAPPAERPRDNSFAGMLSRWFTPRNE